VRGAHGGRKHRKTLPGSMSRRAGALARASRRTLDVAGARYHLLRPFAPVSVLGGDVCVRLWGAPAVRLATLRIRQFASRQLRTPAALLLMARLLPEHNLHT
jgi:hypothetical protein